MMVWLRVRKCVPFDYGISRKYKDGEDRFHFYDLDSPDGKHNLSLLPEQIQNVNLLNENFDPADYVKWTPNWIVDRDWGGLFMSSLYIQIQRCNSIENGQVNLIENSLNIKYAINGTGKSSISKAIQYAINDKKNLTNNLLQLKPFKYRTDHSTNNPEVSGIETIESVAIFNEEYVNQYVFQPSELLKNSFDIFINNDEYKQGMNAIDDLIKDISKTFDENQDIEIMLNDLNELLQSFGSAAGLSKSSSFYKAVGKGNLLENIPQGLEVYRDFIKHDKNTTWIKWQMTGKEYLDISTCCPFCTSSNIEEKRETILAIEQNYDSKLIEHLNKVIHTVSKLKSYFTEDTYNKIIAISKNVEWTAK